MQRFLPPTLALVGGFLLVLGLMAWLWIGPQAGRAPIDQNSQTVSVGTGSYTDLGSQEVYESDQIQSVISTVSDQGIYEGEDPISDDIAVYDQTSGLFDAGRAAPEATPGYPGFPITISGDLRMAIDRVTALPVECCDADAIEGLTIKWPFDVQQESYDLWDGTVGAPVTMNFLGVERIDGLEVHRFSGAVPPTDVRPVSEDAEFPRVMYETTKDYWVEPVTGRIIDSQNSVHQWVIDESGATLFDAADVELRVSDETRAANVSLAKDQTSQLGLLGTVSWLGPLLGILLVLGAAFLVRQDPDPAEV